MYKNCCPNILVVGDLMIDHYLFGSCERISPEAPVQVVDIATEKMVLGGAGNVVNNLKTLGANVEIISVIGDDANGLEVVKLLDKIKYKLFKQNGRKTSKKSRILANKHQVVRFDKESKDDIDDKIANDLINYFKTKVKDADIV